MTLAENGVERPGRGEAVAGKARRRAAWVWCWRCRLERRCSSVGNGLVLQWSGRAWMKQADARLGRR